MSVCLCVYVSVCLYVRVYMKVRTRQEEARRVKVNMKRMRKKLLTFTQLL